MEALDERRREVPRSFGRRNIECDGESIEVVEEANHRKDLDDLSGAPVRLEIRVGIGMNLSPARRHRLGDTKCSGPRCLEARYVVARELRDLFCRRAQPPCQGGMRRQSILTTIDL